MKNSPSLIEQLPSSILYKNPYGRKKKRHKLTIWQDDDKFIVGYFDKQGHTLDGWIDLISRKSFDDAASQVMRYLREHHLVSSRA